MAPTDSRASALREWYVQSARFEAGLDVRLPEGGGSDPAVELVAEIVRSRAGDDEERAAARGRLTERVAAGVEPWCEAWCRAAIGRSLLLERGVREKQMGVVQLLHIPARFGRVHPYLAGLALAQASVALRDLGDAQGADRLLEELIASYPDHPVFDWEPVRRYRPAQSSFPTSRGVPAPVH